MDKQLFRITKRLLNIQLTTLYFFAKPAINSLVIAPLPKAFPGVIKYLASALGLQVRLLDLNAILDMKMPLSEEDQSNGFFAIGAALREGGGYRNVPLFCSQEPKSINSLKMAIRVIVTWNGDGSRGIPSYLHGAAILRPDLFEK